MEYAGPVEMIEEFRYLVLAAQREGSRVLAAALKPLDLTPSQAEALAVLRDAGRPLTVKEVGLRLVCESGSPSRLTSTLVRKGLVQSSQDVVDKRATHLSLTAAGVAAARSVTEVEQQMYSVFAAMLADVDLDPAVAALTVLVGGSPAGDALQRRNDAANR
jgi:MarR family transcriptional regulator, organic hydroperoxide resistance regulator